jgi:Flp pilus assembly protein TadG
MKFRSSRSERGAALVEMAVVLPLLVVLLFGIMEAGWLFSQQVEVRHAAREAARVAAVSTQGGTTVSAGDIRDRACATMDLSNGTVQEIEIVEITSTGGAIGGTGGSIGDNATITITTVYESLTGLLGPIFDGLTVDTSVSFRLEQPQLWSNAAFMPPVC